MSALTHGDGWVSRACRRGYHRHCRSGCECSCHIPGYDEGRPECKQCHTADPGVMRASPFGDFCGETCSVAYYAALQAEMRSRLSPEDAAAMLEPGDAARKARVQAVYEAILAEREPAGSGTTNTETTAPAATVDMIIRWEEVRDGDLALNCHGQLEEATVMPQGNAWQPEGCVSVMLGGSWHTPRKDKLTAVRRPIAC